MFVNDTEQQWYQRLNTLLEKKKNFEIPSSPSVSESPVIPLWQQCHDFFIDWIQEKFIPLEEHWVVRWSLNTNHSLIYHLWFVQHTPKRGALSRWNPREGLFMNQSVGSFFWKIDKGQSGDLIWKNAQRELVIGHAFLDNLGLIQFQENVQSLNDFLEDLEQYNQQHEWLDMGTIQKHRIQQQYNNIGKALLFLGSAFGVVPLLFHHIILPFFLHSGLQSYKSFYFLQIFLNDLIRVFLIGSQVFVQSLLVLKGIRTIKHFIKQMIV